MTTKLFEPGAADVLYLVDLSGYVFRAYHAIGMLTSSSGEPTNAVYGTVTMLDKLVRQRKPALLGVAMDSRRASFRREIYPEYKANRDTPPEDLVRQFPRVAEVVEASAIPILQQEGMEADDVIATAVRQARKLRLRVVIVSADKDLMQLVGDDVLMWDSMRDRVVGPIEVLERFGVRVDQVRDLLALMGDTSDNVPGVPSVGPKTARDLLVEHGTLEGVYEHLQTVKRKKLQQTLADHREQALLSQELVTLRDDCDVTVDPEALRFGGRDVPRLRALYGELGFHRLLSGLSGEATEVGTAEEPTPVRPASQPTQIDVVVELEKLSELVRRAASSTSIGLAAEGCELGHFGQQLAGIAVALRPGEAAYIPLRHRSMGGPKQLEPEVVERALQPVLARVDLDKTAHDGKRLEVLLRHNHLQLSAVAFDTLLASYLLDPEARHGLAEQCERELGILPATYDDVTKPGRGKRIAFDEVPVSDAARYVGARADLALRLREQVAPQLETERLAELLHDLELPLSQILAEMELAGVLIDPEQLKRLGVEVSTDLERLEAHARKIVGRDFNVNSPRQLETILFDDLKLKPIKRTKTSRSTDAATLEALADEHPLPRVILEHRQLAKLKGTYIDALPHLIRPETGRIHSSWEQAVAATGRLSSTDPNLQNIPIRTGLGRRIRAAFVAPAGHQLVSADYSQIELRVLAHLSQDPVLLDAFRTGQDVHTRTAMEVFEVNAEGVTAEMRRQAKAVNFGIIYGQGDSGLAKSLGITRAEASSFIASYYRRYEGVRRFMDETLQRARAGESVRSLLGRRRMLPDIGSANRAKRLAAERIAMNMPIQGTAADILKQSMLALAEPVTPGTRMVLTVHDELVFEVPNPEVEIARQRIQQAMENVIALDVPLVVDVGSGADWNAAH